MMNLIIVVDSEDEGYKSCMRSMIQLFINLKCFKDISESLFIINGYVLKNEKDIASTIGLKP